MKQPRGHAASPPPIKWPPAQPSITATTTATAQPLAAATTIMDRKKSLRNHRLFRGFSSPDTATLNGNSSATFSGRFRKRSIIKSHINHDSSEFQEDEQQQHIPVLHPPLKKHQAAILLPTTVKAIHADPCVSLLFRESTLVTTDRRGRIRTWGRP